MPTQQSFLRLTLMDQYAELYEDTYGSLVPTGPYTYRKMGVFLPKPPRPGRRRGN